MSALPSAVCKLRPSKVANALRRRWFERRVAAIPLERRQSMVHLGTEYGGWWIPADLIEADWLCYSVGAGSDVSFDLELIARYGIRVRSFDPYALFGEMASNEAGRDPRFTFHEVAIAANDGPLDMYGRQDLVNGSVSAANLYNVETVHRVMGRSLASLMVEFDEDQVQLLKMDVEGIEYDLLPSLDLRAMGVRVFCIELHHNRPVSRARELIAHLEAQGFIAVHRKHPSSFTFVRSS